MTGPATTLGRAPRLHGRGPHLRAVAALLDGLRERPGALVVTGGPGTGRTVLLDHAARAFTSGPVIRLGADRARERRPYDGLRAVARAAAGAPDGSLLSVLRAAAAGEPLLLCVDDAHLWDAASRAELAVAARRLAEPDRIGLLLSVAAPAPDELAALPAARLGPLPPPAAAALLDDLTGPAVDPAVREELLEEAEGNPALLLALAGRLSPAELSGRLPLPRPLTDTGTLTAVAGHHLGGLPARTDDLLLVTAASLRAAPEESEDAAVIARALERLATGEPAGTEGPVPRTSPHRATAPDGHLPGAAGPPRAGLAGLPCGEAGAGTPPVGELLGPVSARTAGDRAAGPDSRAGAGEPPRAGLAGLPCGAGAGVSGPAAGDRAAAPVGRAGAGEQCAGVRGVGAGSPGEPAGPVPGVLVLADGRLRFGGGVLRRAVYARAAPGRRRRAHRALAEALEETGDRLRALLHRAWATAGPDPALAAELAAAAADPGCAAPLRTRSLAHARAAELTADGTAGALCRVAAAETALGAGLPRHALRLADAAARHGLPDAVRGRAELLRGTARLLDGPVAVARESLLTAAALLADPALSRAAATRAADAAWGAGDLLGCLEALADDRPAPAAPAVSRRQPLDDYRRGIRAVLEGHREGAVGPLRRFGETALARGKPEGLLRAAVAALVVGDMAAAARAAARALAVARADGGSAAAGPALEFLAYAQLRSGRHAQARAHAEEGLRAARHAGQRNIAAGHHAVLALAASIEGETDVVAAHATAALETARRHGLAQTATLAQWALGRADLGRGRPLEAADRLGPLVRPGPRRGHFAVWMLAVPCFVEAAALAGRPADARPALDDLAAWAAFGADPQAPAQLLRCRALLAPPDTADVLYARALDLHEGTVGDFERARTELLYGKWLRRRRRLREARDRLGAALVGFESCGARVWADQTRAELRAHGTAPGPAAAGALAGLTPQQCRIARHVADGATNREVARILSVSTRTVDYHLRNVFAALGVRSRVELARLVEQSGDPRGHAGPP
ncbi:LuxR C-terminal-related transcriptional regulator [Streptomyces sp. NPDC093094]|uniref:helix-turn-helix transcriptional regulator n=1 Tax=Streptomyces sp. NPDC093094 TaxID=3366026 RepID=UPI0037F893C6